MTRPGETSPESGERIQETARNNNLGRRENSWEPPRTAVAEEMARLGFTDCWASVGRPGPVSTCRSGHNTVERGQVRSYSREGSGQVIQ